MQGDNDCWCSGFNERLCPFPQVVLPALKQLVESCWVGDYEARPEFDDIIETLEKIAKDMRPDFVQDSGDSSSSAPTEGCCTIS